MVGENEIIQQAFDVWAAVTPLTFTRVFVREEADIVLSWEVGDHGDGFPFDGVGTTLAHAFPPNNNQTLVHFDDSETWGITGASDTDLLSVAIHEIGHALDVDHSNVADSIMFPTISGQKRRLHELDIKGIRSRYPEVVAFGDARTARISLAGLKNAGGCEVKRAVFSRRRPLVAWAQKTMADSLADFDRDNAGAAEIIEIDENRIDPIVFGGEHWGTEGSPNNVHPGAFAGTARSVTFRMSATHSEDLDVFGVGCVLIFMIGDHI